MGRGSRPAHCPLPRTLGGSLPSATHDRRQTHRFAGSGGSGSPGWHRDRGAGGGRGVPRGDPPLAVSWILRGIHGAPCVPTGRRAALPRLEDLGAGRSAVREAVRARNESARHAPRGREPVDGLARCARPAHQARLRRSAGGGPGADSAPAARRYGADHIRRGCAAGDPGSGQDGPVDPSGARIARYAGRPRHGRGGRVAASHGLAGAPRSRGPRVRSAVRPGPRAHRAPLPAPPRPQRHRVPLDGSGGGRADRSSRGALSRSGVCSERRGAAARAGARIRRDGASRGGGMAERVPPPRDPFGMALRLLA